MSRLRFNDSDHLKDPDLYSDKSDREGEQDHEESDPEGLEESDSDTSEHQDDSYIDLDPNEHLRETPYMEQSHEELGEVQLYIKLSLCPQRFSTIFISILNCRIIKSFIFNVSTQHVSL